MPDYSNVEARTLKQGDRLSRGMEWWTVDSVREEPRRLGGPVVVVKAVDPHDSVRDFTLPADQPVRYRRDEAVT